MRKILKIFGLFVAISLVIGLGIAFNKPINNNQTETNDLIDKNDSSEEEQKENNTKEISEEESEEDTLNNSSVSEPDKLPEDKQTPTANSKKDTSKVSSTNKSKVENNTSKNDKMDETNNSSKNENENNSSSKTCIPKKFDLSFFRADFDDFEKCKSIGSTLVKDNEKYIGYVCDYSQDKCGTTYYMLSVFDADGNYYQYNTLKP